MINNKLRNSIDSTALYDVLDNMVQELLAKEFRSIVIDRYQPEIETPIFGDMPLSYICEVKEYSSLLNQIIYNDLFGNKSKRPERARFEPIFSVSEVVVCKFHPSKNKHSREIIINSKDTEIEAMAKKYLEPIRRFYNAKIYSTIGF